MASARWSSPVGFFLATVGAAVGLGNIWRFSAVVVLFAFALLGWALRGRLPAPSRSRRRR